MTPDDLRQLARYYDGVAEALDIPDSMYEDAVRKYQEVGKSLAAADNVEGRKPPDIFPQGSFNLGTVIRPLSDRDEYDIDLVYRRDLRKTSVTQARLKEEAGSNLQVYLREKESKGEAPPALEPGRRCWTLTYEGFHMDVLPAIPNDEAPPTGLLITDTELTFWQHSNPQGYAEWFKSRMAVRLRERRERLAKATLAAIENVPEWRVRTPLQRAVQILKRHRDYYFKEVQEHKPASILLTTLAAKAYSEEDDILAALDSITSGMGRFIENRGGIAWVANPADPEENFADKWRQKPERREYFNKWLKQVRVDFERAMNAGSIGEALGILQPVLGEGVVNEVIERFRARAPATRGALVKEAVPHLGSVSHVLAPHWEFRSAGKVRITADVYNSGKTKKLWIFNSSRGVPKNFALCFRAHANVRGDFRVHWQVVNTGLEAVQANGLRGDFYEGIGINGEYRWESTLYAGTHWVEAFVVRDGICLGRSGRFYVRIHP